MIPDLLGLELVVERRRAQIREAVRRYRAAHPERYREQYAANPEMGRERTRKWRAANPERHREYTRKWSAANPERLSQARRERQAAHIAAMNRLKSGGCVDCGLVPDNNLAKLHFHHVDPATKSFDIGTGWGRSRARLATELAKCIIVCASCHHVRHRVLRFFEAA